MTNKKIIWSIFIGIVLISLLIGITFNNNLRTEHEARVLNYKEKIDNNESIIGILKLAVNHNEKVKAAVNETKLVFSKNEISKGMSQGWIVGCGDELSDDCKKLIACNEKQDLINWDDLDNIQKSLANMNHSLRTDLEVWLKANTYEKTGWCMAGYWAGNASNLATNEDTTNILSGYVVVLSKENDKLKSEQDTLKAKPYFLWFVA